MLLMGVCVCGLGGGAEAFFLYFVFVDVCTARKSCQGCLIVILAFLGLACVLSTPLLVLHMYCTCQPQQWGPQMAATRWHVCDIMSRSFTLMGCALQLLSSNSSEPLSLTLLGVTTAPMSPSLLPRLKARWSHQHTSVCLCLPAPPWQPTVTQPLQNTLISHQTPSAVLNAARPF